MNRFKKCAVVAMITLPVVYFAGCRQAVRIPASFELNEDLGTFEVTAGGTTQNKGSGNLGETSPNFSGGAVSLDPDDISFVPSESDGGKGRTNFQGDGGSFSVIAAIAAIEDVETVCDTPVSEYGPFVVTLDEDNNVESIEPNSVELDQETMDLINSGAFSLCITVESNVDGTITIDALSFELGL